MGRPALNIELGAYIITVVAKTLTVKHKETGEALTHTYQSPQALRVIIGRLMSAKTNDRFLADLVRKLKRESL